MKLTTKQILITIAVITVILIAVGLWFYSKGKKQTTIKEPPLDNPILNDGTNGTGVINNPNSVSSSEITAISNDLFEDMSGFNWSGHNVEPYQRLSALSDTDFVNVYNVFNNAYQSQSGATLKQWIEAESYAFNDVTDSIKERMGRLNLM